MSEPLLRYGEVLDLLEVQYKIPRPTGKKLMELRAFGEGRKLTPKSWPRWRQSQVEAVMNADLTKENSKVESRK
jgi:hypothetical protein